MSVMCLSVYLSDTHRHTNETWLSDQIVLRICSLRLGKGNDLLKQSLNLESHVLEKKDFLKIYFILIYISLCE